MATLRQLGCVPGCELHRANFTPAMGGRGVWHDAPESLRKMGLEPRSANRPQHMGQAAAYKKARTAALALVFAARLWHNIGMSGDVAAQNRLVRLLQTEVPLT